MLERLKARLAARAARKRHHGGEPTPEGMFRLMVLDDNPWPTYTGWREWCDGKKFWLETGGCECRHTEAHQRGSRIG